MKKVLTVVRWKVNNIAKEEIFYLLPGKYRIVTDGKIKDLKLDPISEETNLRFNTLKLASDAKDVYLVDGIGEILAVGNSYTTITIQKCDEIGNEVKESSDNDEIFMRTNAGTIKDKQGKEQIRNLKLSKGIGKFRLYSENKKRLASNLC
jgi:hypothetical protein